MGLLGIGATAIYDGSIRCEEKIKLVGSVNTVAYFGRIIAGVRSVCENRTDRATITQLTHERGLQCGEQEFG